MKHLIFAGVMAVTAFPVLAQDVCDDLWFTRNAQFDQAGYCFGSALGQAVFDNRNCIGTNVTLSPMAKRIVDQAKQTEARIGCRVDTGQRQLALSDLTIRRQLIDQPVLDELPGGCLGWQSGVTPLRAGHNPNAPVIGQVVPGDYVSYSHLPVGDWTYVTTHTPNWTQLKTGGWIDMRNERRCAQFIP